jgi:hypothetical protein
VAPASTINTTVVSAMAVALFDPRLVTTVDAIAVATPLAERSAAFAARLILATNNVANIPKELFDKEIDYMSRCKSVGSH